MSRFIRSLFSLTTFGLIVLFGLSIKQTFLIWGYLVALLIIYLAIVWIPEAWWTPIKHILAVSIVVVLVVALNLSASVNTFPTSLLLIPLVLLLARDQQSNQFFIITLVVITMLVMVILAPRTSFIWAVLSVTGALFMSVRAVNIYKAAYRLSLQNIEELQAARRELQQTNEALQEATVHSMRYAALAERTRLAQEIHDGLGHHLTSLIVQLQALEIMLPEDPVRGAQAIPGMLESARRAMAEVHMAVRNWRDDEGGEGLVALQGLVSQCAATAPFSIEFEMEEELSSWSDELSVALYRILQEALTNIMRHAKASKVDVRIREQADRVNLTVSDDGCYTVDPPIKPGYGIRGIQERCQEQGGTCQIFQTQPHGLTIQVSLPIIRAGVGRIL
ncbi:MAG: sensor histidine kinase [Anaerolineales bacterium]|jgi:signal transduction histidine kinase